MNYYYNQYQSDYPSEVDPALLGGQPEQSNMMYVDDGQQQNNNWYGQQEPVQQQYRQQNYGNVQQATTYQNQYQVQYQQLNDYNQNHGQQSVHRGHQQQNYESMQQSSSNNYQQQQPAQQNYQQQNVTAVQQQSGNYQQQSVASGWKQQNQSTGQGQHDYQRQQNYQQKTAAPSYNQQINNGVGSYNQQHQVKSVVQSAGTSWKQQNQPTHAHNQQQGSRTGGRPYQQLNQVNSAARSYNQPQNNSAAQSYKQQVNNSTRSYNQQPSNSSAQSYKQQVNNSTRSYHQPQTNSAAQSYKQPVNTSTRSFNQQPSNSTAQPYKQQNQHQANLQRVPRPGFSASANRPPQASSRSSNDWNGSASSRQGQPPPTSATKPTIWTDDMHQRQAPPISTPQPANKESENAQGQRRGVIPNVYEQKETLVQEGRAPIKSIFEPITQMPELWNTMFDPDKGIFQKVGNGASAEAKAKIERNRKEWLEQQRLLNTSAEDLQASDQDYGEAIRDMDVNTSKFELCPELMAKIHAAPTTLSSAQFKAAAAVTTRPLLVFAGPGSGKTRFISSRAAALLSLQRTGLCALTYTVKAAQEMKKRITENLRTDYTYEKRMSGYGHIRVEDNCHVSTIHSFCRRVVVHFSKYVFGRNVDNVHVVNCNPFVLSKIHEVLLPGADEEAEEEQFKMDPESANIHKASPQIITRALRDPAWLLKQDVNVRQGVQNYIDRIRVRGAVDLSELIVLATRVLTVLAPSLEVTQFLHDNLRFLFVDELQDCDQYELALLRILHMDGCHITAVGDDDQSIFDWRFQDTVPVDCFYKMRKLFTEAQVTSFTTNFRCPPTVVRVMRQLVDHNSRRFVKDLVSSKEGQHEGRFEPVKFKMFDDGASEMQYVAESIRRMKEDHKSDWKDIAVLSRLQDINRELVQVLRANNIPAENSCEIKETRYMKNCPMLNTAASLDLFAWVRLSIEPHHRGAFLRAYNIPARRLSRKNFLEMLPWQNAQSRPRDARQERVHDSFYQRNPLYGKPQSGQQSLFNALKEGWRRSVFHPKTRNGVLSFMRLFDQLIELMDSTPTYAQLVRQGADVKNYPSVANVVDLFMRLTKYEKHVKSNKVHSEGNTASRALASIDEFSFWAKKYKISQKCPTLRNCVEAFITDACNGKMNKETDTVTVSTIHSAKGLEWKTVFVVRCNQGILPMDDNKMEEERRLMYVAGTRASERVIVTAAKQYVAQDGSIAYSEKSPFVKEMGLAATGENYGQKPNQNKNGNDHHAGQKRPAEEQTGGVQKQAKIESTVRETFFDEPPTQGQPPQQPRYAPTPAPSQKFGYQQAPARPPQAPTPAQPQQVQQHAPLPAQSQVHFSQSQGFFNTPPAQQQSQQNYTQASQHVQGIHPSTPAQQNYSQASQQVQYVPPSTPAQQIYTQASQQVQNFPPSMPAQQNFTPASQHVPATPAQSQFMAPPSQFASQVPFTPSQNFQRPSQSVVNRPNIDATPRKGNDFELYISNSHVPQPMDQVSVQMPNTPSSQPAQLATPYVPSAQPTPQDRAAMHSQLAPTHPVQMTQQAARTRPQQNQLQHGFAVPTQSIRKITQRTNIQRPTTQTQAPSMQSSATQGGMFGGFLATPMNTQFGANGMVNSLQPTPNFSGVRSQAPTQGRW